MPFECPRCHQSVDERFYGPCPSCRGELRAAMAGTERAVDDAAAYEPAMHVTPNAVALKDD